MRHPEVVANVYAETRPGLCPGCDGPIPAPLLKTRGRPKKLCGLEECLRAYHRAYCAFRREKLGAK